MANSPVDYNRLACAINAARLILKVPRENTLAIVREAAGSRYANASAERVTKLNLLGIYQSIVAPLLVSNEPRYYLSTPDHPNRASVRIEQDWLNEQCVHIGLADVGRSLVTNALYSTGILKIALATPCDAAMEAWGITAGEPIASSIDLDDWVYDVSAKDFQYAAFAGHRYRCPIEVAKKMYRKKAEDLSPAADEQYNREGDERLQRILKGTYTADEFEPHVELWEIYLPRHGLVCTLADQDVLNADQKGNAQPLWVQKWVGAPTGPYLFLKFATVPGQALARSPMSDLYELHVDANNVSRKVNNTLRRLKEITIYARNQSHDATAIRDSVDGDMVPVDNPDKIQQVVTAGAAVQGLFVALATYKDLFSFSGGNLELLGGRAAQSKTATQDKILAANAGGGISSMHDQVSKILSAAGENLLWYAHHHPQLVMESEYKPAGSRGVLRRLHPAGGPHPNRDFPFKRSKLRIDPYSVRYRDPQERLAFVQGVVTMFTPLLPMLAQQGVALDANGLVQLFAELGDCPELVDAFTIAQQQAGQGAGVSHERTLAPQTDRSYTRTNNPQPQGAQQQMAEMSPSDFGQQQPGQAA